MNHPIFKDINHLEPCGLSQILLVEPRLEFRTGALDAILRFCHLELLEEGFNKFGCLLICFCASCLLALLIPENDWSCL